MDKETYEDLFKNVVINGHYPMEKLDEMKGYIETLQKQNKFLMERENKLQVLEMKEKEFIKWLELNWKETQDIWFVKIINKHKEIIGDKK